MRADKFGPQLEAKLTPKYRVFALPKIKSLTGSLTQNPKKILDAFQSFYSNLYLDSSPDTHNNLDSFLESIPLPKPSDSHCSILDSPFQESEIRAVIKDLKKDSAPGPDGFSTHYFKTFTELLSPYLSRFFNSLSKAFHLDPAANLAYISVISKLGKDPSEVSNYRPISLINNDLKIMTKRLASLIGSYIHKDQMGFIPGRQGPDQIWRAVNTISLMKSGWDGGPPPQEGYLLSIDLQKAFDTVAWPYLFTMLQKWGFGPDLIKILEALYY